MLAEGAFEDLRAKDFLRVRDIATGISLRGDLRETATEKTPIRRAHEKMQRKTLAGGAWEVLGAEDLFRRHDVTTDISPRGHLEQEVAQTAAFCAREMIEVNIVR